MLCILDLLDTFFSSFYCVKKTKWTGKILRFFFLNESSEHSPKSLMKKVRTSAGLTTVVPVFFDIKTPERKSIY